MMKDQPLPYVTFPIIGRCQFRCPYCASGGRGELAGSKADLASVEQVEEVAEAAYRRGIRKFRVTGGEPFLHPEVGSILKLLTDLSDTTVSINTNGAALPDRQGIISQAPANLKIIVSLDTLKPERFSALSGVGASLDKVKTNIRLLAERSLLYRINMVVTSINHDESNDMIKFCKDMGCNLKISDVATTFDMNKAIEEIYSPVREIESNLRAVATDIREHYYSRFYGIPQTLYLVSGVWVTIKNSDHGAKFNLIGPCQTCPHFPCEEGLYFIYSLPDGSFSGCRMKGLRVQEETIDAALKKVIAALSSLSHVTPRRSLAVANARY